MSGKPLIAQLSKGCVHGNEWQADEKKTENKNKINEIHTRWKKNFVMVMKLIFHVENDENTKKRKRSRGDRPKQCCQLPSHANVRATVAKPMITRTERPIILKFIIIIDCIIWTHDILINGCSCVLYVIFYVAAMTANKTHRVKQIRWKERKHARSKRKKNRMEEKRRKWACNNRLINEIERAWGKCLQQSSRSRAKHDPTVPWFGFIEFLCKQNCKNGQKTSFMWLLKAINRISSNQCGQQQHFAAFF